MSTTQTQVETGRLTLRGEEVPEWKKQLDAEGETDLPRPSHRLTRLDGPFFEELFHAKGRIAMHRQPMHISSLLGLVSTATIALHGHPIRCRTITKAACTSTTESDMNSLSGISSEYRQY